MLPAGAEAETLLLPKRNGDSAAHAPPPPAAKANLSDVV
jgi:hypothetical protein